MGLLSSMTVEFKVDLTNLTSGISRVKQELASVSSSASSSSGGLLSGFKNAAGGLLDFGAKVGQAVIGVQGLAQGAIALGTALLGPAATAETTQLSFETLLHSTKAAHAEMVALNTFASSTPLKTEWVDTAAEKMLAFGFSTKDLIPDITAIGDSLSGLGKLSDASLGSIVDIFGKIRAQGKLTGGDMMQLSTWGIPAWNELAQSMGKSVPELQKMVSAGLVPADVAIKGLTQGMEKTFGGGMAKQANTFTGIISTLESNFQIAMAAIGGPALKVAEQGLGHLSEILASPGFQNFATTVGQKIGDGINFIATSVSKLAPLLQNINLSNLKNGLAQVDPLFASLSDHAGELGHWFQTSVVPAFNQALPGFRNLGDALLKLLPAFEQTSNAANGAFKQAFNAFLPIFERVVPLVIKFAGVLADGLGQAIKFLTPYFVQASTAVSQFAGEIATRVAPIISQWLNQLQTGIKDFMIVWKAVWPSLSPILKGAWDQIVGVVKIAWALLSGLIKIGLDLLSGNWKQAWEDLKAMLAGVWDGIVTYLKGALETMIGSFKPLLQAVANIPGPIGDMAKKVLDQFNKMKTGAANHTSDMATKVTTHAKNMSDQMVGHSIIPDMVNAVVSWFAQLPGRALQAVQNLGPQISGYFSNLATQALSWGANIINSIASGITSASGSVISAASGVAGQIASFLGFHSPAKKGPGSDADRWMPNLVNMLSSGLIAGVPKMQSTAVVAAQPLRAFAPSSAGATALVAAAHSGGSSNSGIVREQHFHLEVDSMELAHIVNNATDRHVRLKLGSRGRVA